MLLSMGTVKPVLSPLLCVGIAAAAVSLSSVTANIDLSLIQIVLLVCLTRFGE